MHYRHQSIFIKLLLIMAILGLLLVGGFTLLMRSFIGQNSDFEAFKDKNLIAYASYLQNDLTRNPSQKNLDHLARKTGMDIIFKSSTQTLQSHPKLPSIEKLKQNIWHKKKRQLLPQGKFGYLDGRVFALFSHSDGEVVFLKESGFFEFDPSWLRLLGSILLIFIIVSFAFLILRKLFYPIRKINSTVKSITQGNLDSRIETNRKDELGLLSQNINQMAESLQNLIRSKEILLSDISHELRSPITRMKLSLEFIPNSNEKDDLIHDLAQMEALIANLLDEARLNNGQYKLMLEPFSLSTLIGQLANQFPQEKNRLQFETPPHEVMIKSDQVLLSIALRNIIDNALKYSKNRLDKVFIAIAVENESVQITVTDHGVGIPHDKIKHIYEPFFQSDESRHSKGFGLGLSITKKIIHKLNGALEIHSELHRYTKAVVTLPTKG